MGKSVGFSSSPCVAEYGISPPPPLLFSCRSPSILNLLMINPLFLGTGGVSNYMPGIGAAKKNYMGKKYPCSLISRVLFPSPPEFRERRRKKVFFMDVCHTRRHLCYPRPRSFRKQYTNVLDMLHAPPPTFVGTTCGFPSAPENVKGGGEEEATHAAFVSPHNFHLYTPRLFMPGLIREKTGGAPNEVA